MGFRAAFSVALTKLYDLAGEDMTFTPAGGAAIPCKAFIEYDVQLQPQGETVQVTELGTTIEMLLTVIGKVPTRGDVVTYGATAYDVLGVITNNNSEVKVWVS